MSKARLGFLAADKIPEEGRTVLEKYGELIPQEKTDHYTMSVMRSLGTKERWGENYENLETSLESVKQFLTDNAG